MRVHDEEEQQDGQDILKVQERVVEKVPEAQDVLVPVRGHGVPIVVLIGDKLMKLATLELHLLLVVLVLVSIALFHVVVLRVGQGLAPLAITHSRHCLRDAQARVLIGALILAKLKIRLVLLLAVDACVPYEVRLGVFRINNLWRLKRVSFTGRVVCAHIVL